ncbi:MAG: NTP transferase domain-containing protein [Candidatus Lokiarchaeota archaeon]|nr:NTP transferase domain-containing protein [Candidatus Lokiarchaeota archaeon]
MKKAAILAAGDSTRMMPLSANIPKHLLPVAGKPLIFHTLKALQDAGIRETLVVYGYRGDELRKAIDNQDWGEMIIEYTLQEKRMGTAHAAGYAREFAGDDEILLMYGDIMVEHNSFSGLIDFHHKHKNSLTMAVYPVEDISAYGVVVVKDKKVTDISEKPKLGDVDSNLINAGIFGVNPDLWDAIDKTELSSRGEYEITDSIMMLASNETVGAYTLPSWWVDVGKPWDLLEANKQILSTAESKMNGTIEEGAVLKKNVIVEEGAIIRSGAYIQGPVFIGKDCKIGPNCYIRPYTSLMSGVKVGNACEVKNSLIMEESSIGHLSYVGDSIIGRKVNFGAGTTTANLRHDNKSVNVTIKGERLDSGRRKLGTIIGDHVKTGIGTLIYPGAVLHPHAQTGIGVIVDRDIQEGKLIVAKQEKRELKSTSIE